MSSTSTSSQSSRGQSTSTPQNMYSAQTSLALSIAQAAAALGEQVFNWATQTYAATSAMTDAAVSNYLNFSQIGLGLGQQQLQQYEGTYVPEMNQLASEAGSYSSAAREQVNAGAAESNTNQGVQQGINNARMNLEGFGINPSSGMYGELEEAQNAAGGASAAGAGQEASLATQATGRQLLGESIQVGEQLPGMTVNDLNSAYQGVAGAENAVLANAQTGANLFDAANPFLSTAMNLKYPPVGNASQSTQQSSGSSNSQSPQKQQQQPAPAKQPTAPAPGGYGRGPGASNTVQPNNTDTSALGPGQIPLGGAGGGAGSIAKIVGVGGGGGGGQDSGLGNYAPTDAFGSFDTNQSFGQPNDINNTSPNIYAPPMGGGGGGQDSGLGNYAPTDAFGSFDTNQSFGQPNDINNTSPNVFGADPSSSFGANSTDFNAGDINNAGDFSGGMPTAGGGDQSSINQSDYSGAAINNAGSSGDTINSSDYSGADINNAGGYSGGTGGGYGGYGGYAKGGAIPMPGNATTGGQVPRSASPSQGQQTDDIPARLNAGEFVIPKDVAAWKGHEFFQKLIAQSRKARMGAGAKPQAKAPLPNQGQPTFVSRPVHQQAFKQSQQRPQPRQQGMQ